MITGKTSSGFEFEIAQEKAKSFTLAEKIAEIYDEDNEYKMLKGVMDLFKFLFGPDQIQKVKDHVTAQVGYDDSDKVTAEIFEIIRLIRESNLKKSSSSPESSEKVETI